MPAISFKRTKIGKPHHRSGEGGFVLRESSIAWIAFVLLSFFLGNFVGHQSAGTPAASHLLLTNNDAADLERKIQERVEAEVKRFKQHQVEAERRAARDSGASDTDARFPVGLGTVAAGMAAVPRDEFARKLDTGVPLDPEEPTNSQVLIMYNSPLALPDNAFSSKEASSQTSLPELSVDEALENCDVVHLALTHPQHPPRRQCTAFMGNYESLHLYKFMRLPEHGRLDAHLPLRSVARGAQLNGRNSHKPPPIDKSQAYWKILTTYLKNLETSLGELAPIAQRTAVNNTLIVMVCNFGQSELLLNFLCAARSRNLDVRNLLVFATDRETHDLVASMGVAVFYDRTNYEDEEGQIALPKEAAKRYADKTFRMIMLAKVFCVHMPLLLGYNILFQDADVVWMRNPLEYFEGEPKEEMGTKPEYRYDIYFQDDGNHAEYYSPYSANTGFYYVNNNDKTVHLFNSLLMDGAMILENKSHQIPLIALLAEHASLFGLRIKIFSRDGEYFPGGHAFNYRHSFMRDLFAGVVHPYIFHMSWTRNKDNKIKYLQQMGEWYVQPSCVGTEAGQGDTSMESCCSADAIITCHYRDKPSKIPCKSSPNIDKGKPSFWK